MDLNINELVSHYGSTPQGFVNMLNDSILTRVPDGSGQNLCLWGRVIRIKSIQI